VIRTKQQWIWLLLLLLGTLLEELVVVGTIVATLDSTKESFFLD
jgi:hypothetical protein